MDELSKTKIVALCSMLSLAEPKASPIVNKIIKSRDSDEVDKIVNDYIDSAGVEASEKAIDNILASRQYTRLRFGLSLLVSYILGHESEAIMSKPNLILYVSNLFNPVDDCMATEEEMLSIVDTLAYVIRNHSDSTLSSYMGEVYKTIDRTYNEERAKRAFQNFKVIQKIKSYFNGHES